MGYLALYREWRPKTFSDIVGQEHVKTSLVNALTHNKVAHAYLFSGPRGTGKTTAAKILAKALNCSNGEGSEPCNKCDSCLNIDQGHALDVLEIDAASNRGIDEIRDLREKVKFTSSGGKFKVYIIDEVHMLTTEAFNALLKTLEEPPASVVFVLATTEAHKVPLTILSRVQRFEFERISIEGIVSRLQEVCRDLGREVEEKAIQIIAVKAEGGMRDALSILDQCLLREDTVTAEHVYQIIGMVGEAYNVDLVDTMLEADYGKALAKLGEGVALGSDPRQIIRELLDYLRQALLYLAGRQEPLLSSDSAQRLKEQSERAGLKRLLSWINIILKGEGELKYASNARLAAEMILVQALYELDSDSLPEANQIFSAQAKKTNLTFDGKAKGTEERAESRPKSEISNSTVRGIAEGEDLFGRVTAKWLDILEDVRKKKKSTHAFLLEGKPMGIKEESLLLVFKEGYSFHRDKFNQPENKAVVEEVLLKSLGQKLSLENLLENEFELLNQGSNLDGDKKNSQCIQQAVELFGAQLVQVREDK
ncbi:MAG: DNA polymerase III subunit gamma/tau [Gracilibacter sp. BRH_c7a]|nr:MAG: DNA polymerase III subunit gamma/tau [Gracilibacter sp. BRH_c7a]